MTHLGEECIHKSIATLNVDADVIWADIIVIALGLQKNIIFYLRKCDDQPLNDISWLQAQRKENRCLQLGGAPAPPPRPDLHLNYEMRALIISSAKNQFMPTYFLFIIFIIFIIHHEWRSGPPRKRKWKLKCKGLDESHMYSIFSIPNNGK